MPLSGSTRLGSYEVVAQIGAGGMGEVYQAHDTKLGRDVAIKVLPEAFAHDPERLSRFQREAKMLASLNHPNIATIHGLENSNSTHYLVMELVTGETLADRIKREGSLPVEEALKIAVQVAEALEAAHEKGIIHRDLKPANVKVTPEGKVKVLDFGLAKALAEDTEISDPTNSPTLSMAATKPGVILGTAAYMSPEQARGKAVDKRTDIWAFGCVLYEMLTAKQAFAGETATDIIVKILQSEPEWKALPAATPAKISDLLRRCLQKDKMQRMQAAGDARIEIQEALTAPKGSGPTQASPVRNKRLRWDLATGLALLLVAAAWELGRTTRPAEQPLRPLARLDVDLGSDVSLTSSLGADAMIAPDGTRLVYLSNGRLFTRRLDQSNTTELLGTEGATSPFFSPDGLWVAFFQGGSLKKISVNGGPAVALCDAFTSLGGSWTEDGRLIVSISATGSLFGVPAAGGVPARVTELDSERGESTHRWPQILPGGRAVLFTAYSAAVGFDQADIEVMSLRDHRRKLLVRGGTFGRYLPSGHLVYVSQGTLFAAPFDLDRLDVQGTPVPVLSDVSYSPTNGSAQLDFSQTGTLVYRSGGREEGGFTVQWLDAAGKLQPLLAKPDSYARPKLSPDGERLAISMNDIWIYEWRRDTMTRLTFRPGSIYPVWSPDGRYILFEAPGGIYWTRSDGSGKPQQLTQSKNAQYPWSFTPDGKRLAYQEINPGIGYDLWTVSLENDASGVRAGKPEVFLQAQFEARHPTFSPDGKWLAYSSNESGRYQVYVRAFPDKGGKWQISNSGGLYPQWSRNELFFRTVDNQIMVAGFAVKGDSFVADKPRVWSEKKIADIGFLANYDLAADGKRIVALMPVETPPGQQAQNHVIFLENFFDELRRRVPTGK